MSIFVVSCICRSNTVSRFGKADEDNIIMTKHIARLEKYVLGLDSLDFGDDLIKINRKTDTLTSNEPKNADPAQPA